jgi:hypothetical protein
MVSCQMAERELHISVQGRPLLLSIVGFGFECRDCFLDEVLEVHLERGLQRRQLRYILMALETRKTVRLQRLKRMTLHRHRQSVVYVSLLQAKLRVRSQVLLSILTSLPNNITSGLLLPWLSPHCLIATEGPSWICSMESIAHTARNQSVLLAQFQVNAARRDLGP